ncbi:tetratricopeptide repeat protein [Ulvibacterium sp.]|uniref:tetratricopeptide repeat protein n=1 Tax=Ulvibacterium sp. TaxID=2665914 RepID=UPI003BA8CCBF
MINVASRLLLYGILCCCTAVAQESSLAISEPYGSHTVGFRTWNTFDKSRSFSFDRNRPDLNPDKTIYRPIQVCIWYPAEAVGKNPMKYNEYFFLMAHETGKMELSTALRDSLLDNFLKTEPVDVKILEKELKVNMRGIKEAPPNTKEKFPVLIYGPSWSSSAYENALFSEFLASHGYVVISSPSVGPERREMPISKIGVETQARDMEFLFSILETLPNADADKVAIGGFSLGGLSNVLMMARNSSVDAWIGIDPSIHEAYDFFEDSPYEDYRRFSKPTLFVNSLGYMNELPFYDKLVYSDAYMVNLPHLEHTDLASQFIKLFGSNDTKENVAVKVKGYNLMTRYILAFLNGVFRDKLNYTDMTRQHFNPSKTDLSFVQIKTKKGLPRVDVLFNRYTKDEVKDLVSFLDVSLSKEPYTLYPEADLQKLIFLVAKKDEASTAKELMSWYQSNYRTAFHSKVLKHVTFDKMLELFLEVYRTNEKCDFDYYQLNHTAQLLSMGGKGEESLDYFILNTQLHPNNYQAYFNLGIGYFRMEDFEKAQINFKKCLDLNPDERFKGLANDFLSKSQGNK